MKALAKTAKPRVLEENAVALTEAFVASGGTTRPWAREDIKNQLLLETSSKCAYCEANMLSVSFGDIEHILPKKLFPHLVVDWNNLTIACPRCNGEKSSKYNAALPFVNPFVDSVPEHIIFLGAIAWDVSDRGWYTITELDLNNAHKIEGRTRAIRAVESLLRRKALASGQWVADQLMQLVEISIEEGEYSAATRSYLEARKVASI